jgi:Zn finger protein HypA/HybF involved in hydrogenase expression
MKCKRCKHEWNYKGKKTARKFNVYTNCPSCHTSVKLEKGGLK